MQEQDKHPEEVAGQDDGHVGQCGLGGASVLGDGVAGVRDHKHSAAAAQFRVAAAAAAAAAAAVGHTHAFFLMGFFPGNCLRV